MGGVSGGGLGGYISGRGVVLAKVCPLYLDEALGSLVGIKALSRNPHRDWTDPAHFSTLNLLTVANPSRQTGRKSDQA